MEVILLVIGIIILINIVGLLFHGVGALLRLARKHVLVVIWLVCASPSIVKAVQAMMSDQPELAASYATDTVSPAISVFFVWILYQLIMRARVALWLNQTIFGEAEKFPGGERSVEKELKAGTIKRIDYIYVISVPFLRKYYGKYKALLDSQGAATPKQFSEICAGNPAKLRSSEPLVKAVLWEMVSKDDAQRVDLGQQEANAQGTGYPLFISAHPAMNSNFKRREISLD